LGHAVYQGFIFINESLETTTDLREVKFKTNKFVSVMHLYNCRWWSLINFELFGHDFLILN